MCGIAGIIGKNVNKQTIFQMLETQKHRGPDFTGKYEDKDYALLGHNRLAIIDLSPQSNQPFFDTTGRYVIVFNGEIYNYIELKDALKNQYDFKTESDTEVLLAAYILFGSDCLEKLNGMFAFAIWDNQEKKLFAARDRFGVKPFYYAVHNNNFYFSSEIKALHAAGIAKYPNEKVWASYFAYGSYGMPEETFWEGIPQLPGGHFLEVGGCHYKPVEDQSCLKALRQAQCDKMLIDGLTKSVKDFSNKLILTIKKWYCFEDEVTKQPRNLNFEQAKSHYIALLKDSIKLRFRSDVPVGFNVSGGLDSSVLLAFVNLQEIGNDNDNFNDNDKNTLVNRCHSGHKSEPDTDGQVGEAFNKLPSINAYTFYTNNPDYDELPWVAKMLSKTNNPLTKVLLQAEEVLDLAKNMALQQDEPYGGIPTLAYSKIFEQARKDNVLVLLDGQGMDEQWAGYDYYTQESDATLQGVTNSPYKPNMLSEEFLAKAIAPIYPKPFEDAILNKQYRDLFYTKIPRALRFNDRISMLYSTELREPFLDYRLVEFAFSLPLNFKIKNGQTKYMLREIATEYLANDLVFAPKRALQTPQREWLAEDLKDWVQNSFAAIENTSFSNWFNMEALQKEVQSYFEGNTSSSFHIWQVIGMYALLGNGFEKNL